MSNHLYQTVYLAPDTGHAFEVKESGTPRSEKRISLRIGSRADDAKPGLSTAATLSMTPEWAKAMALAVLEELPGELYSDLLLLAVSLVEKVQDDKDGTTPVVAVRSLSLAKEHLLTALDRLTEDRTEAERRADWEADRADDAISSGEVPLR